jgi:hypothetical protein
MVKKLLFLTCLFVLLKSYSFAQACTPDPQYTNTNTQRGVHPDTLTNLAAAYVGTPYSATLTIVVPKDTTVPILGKINWDSTVLVSVTGLPAGFTSACANSSSKPNLCSWKGNSIGCVIITGNPTAGDIGTHTLLFNTNNYVGGNLTANAYVAKGYKIVVSASAGVSENPNIQVLQQNSPNPFDDVSEIQFVAEDNGVATFKIYNMIGTVMQEYDIAVKKGINKIELSAKDLDSGIYFYCLAHGTNAFTRKMIVKK